MQEVGIPQHDVSWGSVPGVDGYNVYVQYCGKAFTEKSVTKVNGSASKKVIVRKVNGKKLDLKKNYKVYVEAYKLKDGNQVIFGKTIMAHIVGRKNTTYTNVKGITVTKNSYQLKKGKTAAIKAKTVLVNKHKKPLSNAHAKELRYATSDKRVAAVSKTGKIKAAGKGSCTVYVYARNGYAKKIKVKVR